MPNPLVLYVEDEPDDVLLMELAFRKAGLEQALRSVPDGRDAIKYLAGESPYADRERNPLPTLVLLDLNLPVVTGFEVMQWLRQRPEWRDLPVVVFSSSNLVDDRARAKDLGAREFVEKPGGGMEGFNQVVRGLRQRWHI